MNRLRAPVRLSLAALVAGSLVAPALAAAQLPRTHRDEWQNVEGIFAALEVGPGDSVADIGAGDGFLTLRLSQRLGSRGRIFAVDINASTLAELERDLEYYQFDNVEVIVSEPDDPMLPSGALDAAFMVITYHEFTDHEAMLAGIRRALKPTGRLVIVDNPARDPARSRRAQRQRHHIDIGLVARDLEAAGFTVVRREPTFVDIDHESHDHRHWMLVATVAGDAGR
jgi:ubiquinone/menaquinone biosynthesis C-methylase UbiE